MDSSCRPTVVEYQALVESLKDIIEKDAQLMGEKVLKALKELTERHEALLEEQKELREKHGQDQKLQADTLAALENQNNLLRQRIEDQEDEISGHEKEVAEMKCQIIAAKNITVIETGTSDDPRAKLTEEEKKKIDEDLLDAAENGELEDVRSLLVNGAYANAARAKGLHQGWTALILAASEGHLQVVEELLGHRAHVNHATESGWTALVYAACYGRSDVVRALINGGANLNMRDNQGHTALTIASRMKQKTTAKILRRAGARRWLCLPFL